MTFMAWLLIVLAVASAAGCGAYLLPARRLNDEHPYATDPLDSAEHPGRHRDPGDGDTRRLADDWHNRL